MTNKINGIDVSECYFYGDNNCDVGYIADSYPKNCKNNPNCYFKQLKRLQKLQKENEELKKRQITKNGFICDCEQNAKYKQALVEISILAKNYCNACDEFKAKTFKNKNDCLYCNYGFIRRKINEVLNDRS